MGVLLLRVTVFVGVTIFWLTFVAVGSGQIYVAMLQFLHCPPDTVLSKYCVSWHVVVTPGGRAKLQAPEVQVEMQVALTGFQPNELVAHEVRVVPADKKEPTGTWWHVPSPDKA